MFPKHGLAFALVAGLAALVVACGGGGGGGGAPPIPCVATLQPGPVPGDVGGPGGAAGVGDGGGTGAGSAGGVEGQFKRALIGVEQADGKVLTDAQVDDTYGMVRVDLCNYNGPVKFTLKGKADGSTVYYDEGKAAELPFPANETMRVVIESYNKNVGITPLTEAAYQYVTAKYGANGWKTAANVREANETIRAEFNRHLPVALQIEDITRLPAIIGPATGVGTLPASKNALYGTVLSGLAQSAALFNVGEITPALTIARQIGLDLSDGKLDLFYCSNGDPANCTVAPVLDGRAFPAPRSTYSTAQFAEMVNTGISQISARFGNDANKGAALKFTQVKIFSRDASGGGGYTDNSPIFLLRNDGNVYFWPRRDRAMSLYDSGYRQMYAASTMLGSKLNGAVFKDPTIAYPPPNDPNGVATAAFPPAEMPDYFAATRIAGTATTFSSSFNQIVRKQDSLAYVDTRATNTGGVLGAAVLSNVVDVAVARGSAGRLLLRGACRRHGLGVGLERPIQHARARSVRRHDRRPDTESDPCQRRFGCRLHVRRLRARSHRARVGLGRRHARVRQRHVARAGPGCFDQRVRTHQSVAVRLVLGLHRTDPQRRTDRVGVLPRRRRSDRDLPLAADQAHASGGPARHLRRRNQPVRLWPARRRQDRRLQVAS